MESMDELISQAADFISSLLPFLNNINIVGLILSFVSLVLSVLLCFWGYRLFTCFTAGIGFVTGAFLGFLLSGHYFTDELWIILFGLTAPDIPFVFQILSVVYSPLAFLLMK